METKKSLKDEVMKEISNGKQLMDIFNENFGNKVDKRFYFLYGLLGKQK